MDGAAAGVEDIVVDDGAAGAAFEEWVSFDVRGIEVADNSDLGGVVVKEAAFGVSAFSMR